MSSSNLYLSCSLAGELHRPAAEVGALGSARVLDDPVDRDELGTITLPMVCSFVGFQ